MTTRREYYIAERELYKKQSNQWYHKNKEKALASRKRFSLALREEMFQHLGTVCACCGYSDKRFLSLDHINSDGWKERRSVTNKRSGENSKRIARKLGWDKTIYQILCFNCNLAKGVNGGMCPHRLPLSTPVQSL